MATSNLLVYLLRRDLRIEDNPIFHAVATDARKNFTYLLPVYHFPARQIEVSGFVRPESGEKSPYPEAKSELGKFWRCGPHRAKFIAESVWDLKEVLEAADSGLEIRVGLIREVLEELLEGFRKADGEETVNVGAVWMMEDEGTEEKEEEMDCRRICEETGVEFKLWKDEKYFVDDDDVPLKDPKGLPDVFTTYRKLVEPLRKAPRPVLPMPVKGAFLPLPPRSTIAPQASPFVIPSTYSELESSLLAPIPLSSLLANPPPLPGDTPSAHPFHGGSRHAHERVTHLLATGAMTRYKSTRNGLLGLDFSTKLSAYLSLGCITARQIHAAMLQFEDGTSTVSGFHDAEGFGQGENEGTQAVRFELLWRDYMRLCSRKFGGPRLFALGGFRGEEKDTWKGAGEAREMLERFCNGTMGMGLIDASQRELFFTGYTSNRARQNVANFLTKHLGLDWRLGAEWYESLLVDYDASSNWGNWQYMAGVGNDPRGEERIFNPVKQGWDYDPKGEYCRAWIPELQGREGEYREERPGVVDLTPGDVFQACTMPMEKQMALGIANLVWVRQPLKRIEFTVGRKVGRRPGPGGQYRGKRGQGRRGGPQSGWGRATGREVGWYREREGGGVRQDGGIHKGGEYQGGDGDPEANRKIYPECIGGRGVLYGRGSDEKNESFGTREMGWKRDGTGGVPPGLMAGGGLQMEVAPMSHLADED